MEILPFATEHFFAQYEFNTPYQLCNSDCETVTIAELLAMAGLSPADLGRLALGYTESQGHPELRAAVANLYETVTAEQIVIWGSAGAPLATIWRGTNNIFKARRGGSDHATRNSVIK